MGLGGLAEGGQQAVVIAGPGGQHHVARLDAVQRDRSHLSVPVRSVPGTEAEGNFGFLAHFITMDGPVSGALTRERTGWQPVQPGLIPDLDKGHYFD